jgi:hypothetical protein
MTVYTYTKRNNTLGYKQNTQKKQRFDRKPYINAETNPVPTPGEPARDSEPQKNRKEKRASMYRFIRPNGRSAPLGIPNAILWILIYFNLIYTTTELQTADYMYDEQPTLFPFNSDQELNTFSMARTTSSTEKPKSALLGKDGSQSTVGGKNSHGRNKQTRWGYYLHQFGIEGSCRQESQGRNRS